MRRVVSGDKKDFVELEFAGGPLGNYEMPDVRGVEQSAE